MGDGDGGRGQDVQLKNETQKPIIHPNSNLAISEDNAQTQRMAEPKLDTITHSIGGRVGDRESG